MAAGAVGVVRFGVDILDALSRLLCSAGNRLNGNHYRGTESRAQPIRDYRCDTRGLALPRALPSPLHAAIACAPLPRALGAREGSALGARERSREGSALGNRGITRDRTYVLAGDDFSVRMFVPLPSALPTPPERSRALPVARFPSGRGRFRKVGFRVISALAFAFSRGENGFWNSLEWPGDNLQSFGN